MLLCATQAKGVLSLAAEQALLASACTGWECSLCC